MKLCTEAKSNNTKAVHFQCEWIHIDIHLLPEEYGPPIQAEIHLEFEEKEKLRIVNYCVFDFHFCSSTPKLVQYLNCCLC